MILASFKGSFKGILGFFKGSFKGMLASFKGSFKGTPKGLLQNPSLDMSALPSPPLRELAEGGRVNKS